MITITCPSCDHPNGFDQPYPIHAGFSDQGFLYNDNGDLTLVWSSFDPAYGIILGNKNPWALSAEEQRLLEDSLLPAPSGGRWRFANPARCIKCASPVSGPMAQTIYYVLYPGSISTDLGPTEHNLGKLLSLPSS